MIKTFSLAQYSPFVVLLAASLLLLIPAALLSGRIALLTKDNLKAQAALNQIFPGLNMQALELFKKETNQLLETKLLPLVYILDPEDKAIKEDYDPAIYFVDELDKINQSLRMKASAKKVNYTDLGFKEKLPEEKEARPLLKQLYGLQEIVAKGIDSGVNFVSITPEAQEDIAGLPDVKIMKSRLELTAPAVSLLEFIIQIGEATPLFFIESLLLKSQDSILKAEMTVSQNFIDTDWKDKGIPFNPLNRKDMFLAEDRSINTLRASNLFSVPKAEASTGSSQAALPAQEAKQSARFLFRGKAMLKAKEVAVVEDTLSKRTVFLAVEEKIGDFILKELKEQEIILKNRINGQEIRVKREKK